MKESKLTWHYNLMRHRSKSGTEWLEIHEVYVDHNPDGEDGISWTQEPVTAYGETLKEVAESLDLMKSDVLKHKVIDYD